MTHHPLWDLTNRTLALGKEITMTIDGLLRMQNDRHSKRPITLYIMGMQEAANPTPTDTLALCSVIQALRSPVRTVGMGNLMNRQPLILAAGTAERLMMNHSIMTLSPINWECQPMQRGPLNFQDGEKFASAREILEKEMEAVMKELNLEKQLLNSSRVLTAAEAVRLNLADEVITDFKQTPNRSRTQTYEHAK